MLYPHVSFSCSMHTCTNQDRWVHANESRKSCASGRYERAYSIISCFGESFTAPRNCRYSAVWLERVCTFSAKSG
ncbi:hypothetical protein M404DRAFT_269169 [Pisolithus tinctorius Marx 270]|uniref:Uncharacterized protein n=1 Tax=Pisolithus tinctorius Marx 270 TaxID=870435 RepID=A0A0C3KIS5_PISTI|nr:hypothetical protein M404DRAFT_269169 [Pisolithus tinctorius Marx 270]